MEILKNRKSAKKPANESSVRSGSDHVIPVVNEEVIIDKKTVKKGGATIRKEVLTEESRIEVPVTTEHVEINRIPINQYQESRPETRYEGDTLIIPVLKEVMERRLLLVEEIHISKRTETKIHHDTVTLSREKVTVSRKTGHQDG